MKGEESQINNSIYIGDCFMALHVYSRMFLIFLPCFNVFFYFTWVLNIAVSCVIIWQTDALINNLYFSRYLYVLHLEGLCSLSQCLSIGIIKGLTRDQVNRNLWGHGTLTLKCFQ